MGLYPEKVKTFLQRKPAPRAMGAVGRQMRTRGRAPAIRYDRFGAALPGGPI